MEARGTIIHGFLVFIVYSIFASALTLSLPGRGIDPNKKPTRNNYCAGYLSNSLEQGIYINLFYIAGSLFYIVVLKRITPLTFFQKAFPIFSFILGTASILFFFNFIPQLILYIVLSACLSFYWFFFLYDHFFITASIDNQFYGFYGFINGFFQNLIKLIITILYPSVPPQSFYVAYFVVLALSIIWSMVFGFGYRKRLTVASHLYC